MNYEFSDKIKHLAPSAIREILKHSSDPSVISFAAGSPSPETFPAEELALLSAGVYADAALSLQYGITEGYAPLRELLKSQLACDGMVRPTDELIITSGGQQAIDLCAKVLCNEHDTIICENPSFIGSLNAFRAYNLNLCGVSMQPDGINIDELKEKIASEKNVKILYLIPTFQNPTGYEMSEQKRREVYQICKEHGIVIIEDDPYSKLRFAGEDIPTIKSIDTEGIVVYCASFSKIISPGIRLGYCLAPAPIIAKMTVAKQVNDVHTNLFFQVLAHRYLTQYDLAQHIEKIRGIYRGKCNLMYDCMQQYFPESAQYRKPQGGLFMWCLLPEGTDVTAIAKKCIDNKVAIVPGSAFSVDENAPCSTFRLNFSLPSPQQIEQGVQIVGRCLTEAGV